MDVVKLKIVFFVRELDKSNYLAFLTYIYPVFLPTFSV